MAKERTVAALNRLVQACKDSEHGFRQAAEAVKVFDLKQALEGFAARRATFIAELEAEIGRLGGKPAKSGSIVSTLQHGWFHLKTLVTSLDVGDIVTECERGEESVLKAYTEVLQRRLPREVRQLVAQQERHVRDVYERLCSAETVAVRA